ncbi:MAG: GMP synthase [Desulfurococcaceae archaeon]
MHSSIIERTIAEIVESLKALSSRVDCAIACISGGVDSTTAAVLAKRALGKAVHPIFIDTGFMRANEAKRVREALKGLIDVEVRDYSESFISKIEGRSDAEEKRVAFRDCFYAAVKEIAEEKGCSSVVQGTIRADVVETVGGVKTQHNVLNQELLRKYKLAVIEPLINLYKHEVRAVARHLGLPSSIVDRQPFPGPGLLVRAVGRLYREKLELVRRLTDVVESLFAGRGFSQYFPAVWEHDVAKSSTNNGVAYDVFSAKATGVVGGRRSYGHPVVVREWPENLDAYELYKHFEATKYPHILVKLTEKSSGSYVVALRVVKTENFIEAEVPKISFNELELAARKVAESAEIRTVAFDVTPKPPATIEYE